MWFRSLIRSRKSRRPVSSVQRSRRRHTARLRVEALEDRSLPSGTVTLAPSDDSPLVGERVTWTATAADVGATPVYQFSAAPARRRLPRRPRLQPRQHVRLDADAGGHLRHRGHRQGRLPGDRDHLRRGDRRGRLAGDRVAGRRHAHRQPARGPVQRPAVLGGIGVRPVRRGGRPPGLAEHRHAAPSCRGRARTSSSRACCRTPPTRCGTCSATAPAPRPVLFTTGSIPATLTFPAFTVQQPPGPGSDLDQDMVFHQLIQEHPRTPAARGDGPGGAGDVVLRPLRVGPYPRQGGPEPRARGHAVAHRRRSLHARADRAERPAGDRPGRQPRAGDQPRGGERPAGGPGARADPRLPPRRPAAARRDHGRARVSPSAPSTSTAPPPITSAKWSWCSTRTSR